MPTSTNGLHVLQGPRLPEAPGRPFLCEHFRGTLTGGECLRRQTARTKPGAMAKDQSPRIPPHLEYCASGDCAQGVAIAKKFPDWKPEDRPKWNWSPPPPAVAVEQLTREVADLVLSRKKPTWREWKAEKDRIRDLEPVPEPEDRPPHPLSNRGLEEGTMAEGTKASPTCSEQSCTRALRSDNATGLCRDHANRVHQRNYQSRKNGTPRGSRPRAIRPAEGRGQDELDLMIRIRDDFRRLSPDGQRYVLAALTKGDRP